MHHTPNYEDARDKRKLPHVLARVPPRFLVNLGHQSGGSVEGHSVFSTVRGFILDYFASP